MDLTFKILNFNSSADDDVNYMFKIFKNILNLKQILINKKNLQDNLWRMKKKIGLIKHQSYYLLIKKI